MANIFDSISNVLTAGSASATGIRQDVADAKDQIETAYTITTTLQIISTVAVCVIAYTAVQNMKRKG